MNLETIIDKRLWLAIENNYQNRNFTASILDSMYFLSDLIREKTGLESDGVALVGQAFGGLNPKLKVNKLQTESELNEQKGIEQILRGLYQAIRNTRSHEKYNDNIEMADAIIIFINYLVRVIDQSKTPFTKSDFLERVFDVEFVEHERYADIIVREIPLKLKFEIFLDVYNRKETGSGKKLGYFFKALYNLLSEEEKVQVHDIISNELKRTSRELSIRQNIQIFGDLWLNFEEVSRLRIENKIIRSIEKGRYSIVEEKCLDGILGTWISRIIDPLSLKKELLDVVTKKLSSNDNTEQDYIFNFLSNYLDVLADEPPSQLKWIINKKLKEGDKRFYDCVQVFAFSMKEKWIEPFKKYYDEFVEAKSTEDVLGDDSLPF